PVTANIAKPEPTSNLPVPENLWYERASFVAAKDDAVDDHKHCALSHDLAEKPISLKEANKRLGHSADGLDSAVFAPLREAFGDDAKFLTAHFCIVNGRRFSHVVLEYKKQVVSVLLTLRDEGVPSTGRDVTSCRASDNLRAACFESGKYNVFVVSDLTEGDNLLVANTISKSIDRHVTNESKKV
ncbi:MAG: hypothetical protein ABIU09_07090, partial [Pyrinomonadaceae bacterium]